MIASVSVACSNQSGGGGKTSGSPQPSTSSPQSSTSSPQPSTGSLQSSTGSLQSSTGSPQPSTENASSKMSKIPDSKQGAYSFTAEECNSNNRRAYLFTSDKMLVNEGNETIAYTDINSVTYQDGGYDLEMTVHEKNESTNDYVVQEESLNMRFAPNSQNSKAEFSVLRDGEKGESLTLINCDQVIKADKK